MDVLLNAINNGLHIEVSKVFPFTQAPANFYQAGNSMLQQQVQFHQLQAAHGINRWRK